MDLKRYCETYGTLTVRFLPKIDSRTAIGFGAYCCMCGYRKPLLDFAAARGMGSGLLSMSEFLSYLCCKFDLLAPARWLTSLSLGCWYQFSFCCILLTCSAICPLAFIELPVPSLYVSASGVSQPSACHFLTIKSLFQSDVAGLRPSAALPFCLLTFSLTGFNLTSNFYDFRGESYVFSILFSSINIYY